MSYNSEPATNLIKFKSTNTSHDLLQLEFDQNKTVQDYKQQVGELYDYDYSNIKFVFKGKVLNNKEKAGQLGLKNSTVMMVLNKAKQVQKPKPTSAQQTIPKGNLSTGLGSSSPVGFGGYGIMNHPQYMSAISSAVDPQKMQEMLNDPYTESMIEQLMDDPQTLKQLMEQNPMTKQLMEQNPMFKVIMSNPAMMKMVFNKDTIKMAKQMQKNGGMSPQNMPNLSGTSPNSLGGGLAGLGGLNGLAGMRGFSGMGFPGFGLNNNSNNTNVGSNTTASNPNPFGGMMGNSFLPMVGSGFGMNQAMNFPNNQPNLFSNPFVLNSGTNQNASGPGSQNNFFSLFQNLSNVQQQTADQVKYLVQIKQLSSMGFSNKQKCLKFLKESDGDIDQALEKLCLDQDEQESNQTKKE